MGIVIDSEIKCSSGAVAIVPVGLRLVGNGRLGFGKFDERGRRSVPAPGQGGNLVAGSRTENGFDPVGVVFGSLAAELRAVEADRIGSFSSKSGCLELDVGDGGVFAVAECLLAVEEEDRNHGAPDYLPCLWAESRVEPKLSPSVRVFRVDQGVGLVDD